MEVTKRMSNIMKDPELLKKLVYINGDEEYNYRISMEAMKQFQDIEECLILRGDPNPEITPSLGLSVGRAACPGRRPARYA
jgi:hypothetical protein